MRLSPYQMIGLSWMILMFKEGLNAVLAGRYTLLLFPILRAFVRSVQEVG